MASLTPDQIEQLKKRGLDDAKISALAAAHGYSMPGTGANIVSSLTKNVRNFGQSIAGAVGSSVLSDTRENIDEANSLQQQVKQNVISAIQQKREKGEDTSRLINALKTLDKEVNFYDILNTSTGGSLDKSARQVFGEGLGVATDIIGAGALPGGVGAVTKAPGLVRGAIQGLKAGAVGGATFGAAQGVSRAAQENASAGGIVGAGLRGGVEGALVGGALGGVVGGVAGGFAGRGQKAVQDKDDFILDLVSPKADANVRTQAFKEGRVTEAGLFSRSKIIPSKQDYRLADAVDDVVDPKLSVLQNHAAIQSKVDEINTGVTNLIKAKKVPFNTNQLRSRLNAAKDDSKLIFASDATAERTYDAVVDEFISHVGKKDTLGLFQARQAFDRIPAIKKLLESEGLGENVKKQIVLDVRRAANEYISTLLPKNNPYRELLRRESLMLEVIGNIADKGQTTIGKNKIQLLTQKYPILKWVIGGTATGIVGGAGVGVGSTIIGSTD